MEGKVLGISMSVFGALGLVLAFVFMNNTDSSKHLSLLFASGIGGAVIFFTGIWLSGRTAVTPRVEAGVEVRPRISAEPADNGKAL
jgi:hypothetical protein